jgi:predicted transcriptional regulator
MEANTRPAETVLVTTRLDKESHEALTRLAAEADRTIAAEVRRAVREYLERERDEVAA